VSADGPRQVITRRWKYAAPPSRIYQALVDERRSWLEPWPNERTPGLATAVEHQRVVLSPWVDYRIDDVDVLITTDGAQGSQLTVTTHAGHELSTKERKSVRYRLGTLFGEALRNWVGGW
jgi:hypothetical protein